MKFRRRHGEFEQGCVLSESYTATDTFSPILPACCQLVCLLLETPFVTQDVFCSENLFVNWFVRDERRSWTDLFMMRGVREPRFHCIHYCETLKFHRFVWFYYLSVLYSEIMSSSSLSSSESDTGIYTNDEGREGNRSKYKLTNIKQLSYDFVCHDMRNFYSNCIRILSSTCQCCFETCALNFKINISPLVTDAAYM
jgi:hypothetical protein